VQKKVVASAVGWGPRAKKSYDVRCVVGPRAKEVDVPSVWWGLKQKKKKLLCPLWGGALVQKNKVVMSTVWWGLKQKKKLLCPLWGGALV
jgi:hypothetical protein